VFMEEPDVGKMLIANNVDRGYAFVDLGTTEAVARAVSASRGDGITLKDKKLTVEPSKKPVRPSGLKAIAERKGAPGSGAKGSSGGKGKAGVSAHVSFILYPLMQEYTAEFLPTVTPICLLYWCLTQKGGKGNKMAPAR